MNNKQLYLSLCAEIPVMLIHNEWETDASMDDGREIYIFVRSDWDIEVSVDYWEWWWVIDTSDRDGLMKSDYKTEDLHKIIQAKIEFAYELCFSL